MPKHSIDYLNCCIYKIEHIENASLVYVGHTTNFKQRKLRHKSSCNNETDKSKHNYKVYQMIRKNGGWDMFRMIEIEKYPCNDKQEAEKREFEIMKKLNASMNTMSANKNTGEIVMNKCKLKKEKNNEEEQISIDKKYEEYIRACKSNCFFSCFEDTLKWYIKIEIFKEVRIIKEQNKKIYDACMVELDFMT